MQVCRQPAHVTYCHVCLKACLAALALSNESATLLHHCGVLELNVEPTPAATPDVMHDVVKHYQL